MEVGLNSPRGKFKITNMADDQVDLTAEDFAGASFIEEEIEKLTVSQLQFWLNASVQIKMVMKRNCWQVRCTSSIIRLRAIDQLFLLFIFN